MQSKPLTQNIPGSSSGDTFSQLDFFGDRIQILSGTYTETINTGDVNTLTFTIENNFLELALVSATVTWTGLVTNVKTLLNTSPADGNWHVWVGTSNDLSQMTDASLSSGFIQQITFTSPVGPRSRSSTQTIYYQVAAAQGTTPDPTVLTQGSWSLTPTVVCTYVMPNPAPPSPRGAANIPGTIGH